MKDEQDESPVRELESRAERLYEGIEAGDAVCIGRIRAKILSLARADFVDVNPSQSEEDQ